MRNAETVLNVIRERGKRGLPLENIYRLLYNRNLYLRAYGGLYSNQGAMTKGTTAETVDGMSLAKIDRIIEELRYERFRWSPVRRVNIPKPNGKTRALGLPTWTDKLLQEVIRMILEAYYEPQFSDHSHGFRPDRGCHTALNDVVTHWTGVRWFVEGDIKGCFDNIDHEVLLSVLGEKLHDNRFLRLLKYLLKAGYVEDWKYGRTLSGTPQGGVVSPILSNIYLDRLDKFVENVLIPAHTRGTKRSVNLTWNNLSRRAAKARKKGHYAEAAKLRQEARRLPSGDPFDPNYRRLRYVRYADDFVLGFSGPKAEAEQIKESLETFLRDSLKLELSREKTLITHATSQAAKFLGYELVNQQANDKIDRHGRRKVNGRIGLRVPAKVIEQHCRAYMRNGKPADRPMLTHDTDYSIVARYQAEFRGIVQYYLLAQNVFHFGKLQWVMNKSLAKTLANKHKTTARKNLPALQQHRADRVRTTCLSRGLGTAGRWETPTRGTIRWHTPEAEPAGSSRRPEAPAVQVRTQRAYQTAPSERMRNVRVNSGHPSPPHPRPTRPERQGPTGKAPVDSTDGGTTAQDPRGLPDVSHEHPPRAQVIRNRRSR